MSSPVKIVHTSDVHLDFGFAGSGPASYGNRRRQSLREAFRAVVRRAGEWPADALLIAGDLFESDRVTRDTIGFLKAELASIPHVAVVMAPGEHDPFTPTSPYATEEWPVNVHIFRRPDWASFSLCDGALVVHGFAVDGEDASKNPFGALSVPQDGAVHVAVAHGSEQSRHAASETALAPFDAADAAAEGLRYLALGHVHAFTRIGGHATCMAYSGSPEGHGFGEPGERHYAEVTVDGSSVDIRPVESARVVYATHELRCDELESSQDLVPALQNLAGTSPKRLIARVALSGTTDLDLDAELESVHDAVADRFEYLELLDATAPRDNYGALARQETSLGLFVRTLNEEIGDLSEPARTAMVERARELGVAAFHERRVPIRGMKREDP